MAVTVSLPNPIAANTQQTAQLSNSLDGLTSDVVVSTSGLKSVINSIMDKLCKLSEKVEVIAAESRKIHDLSEQIKVIEATMRKVYELSEKVKVVEMAANKVYALAEKVELINPLIESAGKHRNACAAMAEKVDATATPATSFLSTFNSSI